MPIEYGTPDQQYEQQAMFPIYMNSCRQTNNYCSIAAPSMMRNLMLLITADHEHRKLTKPVRAPARA